MTKSISRVYMAVIVGVIVFAFMALTGTASAAKPASCATIQGGTILDSAGNPVSTGYDQWGYNYQSHMFKGFYGNYSRPTVPVTSGDTLIMKWSDSWLANVDCDGDNKLDRGLVKGEEPTGTSMGWLTNQVNGTVNEEHYTDFIKIVWVGPGGDLWGQYTIIQEVWNSLSEGYSGLFSKEGAPGFGLNNQWTVTP